MAPDLNGVGQGAKWDYSTPGSGGYDVPFTVLNDTDNRHVRVIAMGAGVSGIQVAYQLQRHCTNFSLKVFEKNNDIGGTWRQRYPGCACDIPSHAYTYSFATNPDWPYFFSYSSDIWAYLNNVCETFDLRKYMAFNTRIVGCYWQEVEGEWLVKIRHEETGEVFEERCDLLLQTCGLLDSYKYPNIPGMDKFKGKIIHTATWPKDYNAEEWKKESVAVIGSGASSIQTVPTMQPHVKHMDVFVRTGVWFVAIANNQGSNKEYSEEEKAQFRKDPEALARHGNSIETQVNGLWGSFYSGNALQGEMTSHLTQRMSEYIKDERLLKGFLPTTWRVGCRRVTPGDPFMLSIQQENVDVHFTAVKAITEDGLVGQDDVIRKCDTIICATGYDTTYTPRFELIGRNGVNLAEKWKDYPSAYLGIAAADIPNYFMFLGPPFPVENGSVMGSLLSLGEYVCQVVKKFQFEDLKSISPKQSAVDSFNDHVQEWLKHTVWVDPCRSWYKNNETGRVNAVWPGSSLHYQHIIARPRWEDYEIEYNNKRNMWAFMGIGWSIEDRDKPTMMERANRGEISYLNEQAAMMADPEISKKLPDIAPYINARFIDPKWLVKAFGWSEQEAEDYAVEQAAKEAGKKRRQEIRRERQGLPSGRYGWAESQTGLEHRI